MRKAHLPTKHVDAPTQTQRVDDDSNAIDDHHLDEEAAAPKRRQRRSRRKDQPHDDIDGNETQTYYNDDVWHAIARHIDATDVGRFAGINRQTADITRTATFWTHLYRREYARASTAVRERLPERLRPACMVRLGGLRACTIRALFHCNAELAGRLPATSTMVKSTETRQESRSIFDLVRRECIGTWTLDAATKHSTAAVAAAAPSAGWWHCYRLRARLPVGSRMATAEAVRKSRIFERVYRDIYQNADESCVILAIRMGGQRPLPLLLGQASFVTEIRHNLSGRGCADYRLSLEFRDAGGDVLAHVVYDPVLEVKVLDWWQPSYEEFVGRTTDEGVEWNI